MKRNRLLIGWDRDNNNIEGDELTSPFSLEIEGLPQIPVTMETKFCSHSVIDTLTPFHPENGYMIGSDDLNIDKREQKVKKVLDEIGSNNIDVTLDPFGMFIDSTRLNPQDFGFTPENMGLFINFLNNLRLQITLPGTIDRDLLEEDYRPALTLEASPLITVINSQPQEESLRWGVFLDEREGSYLRDDWDPNGKVQLGYDRFYPMDNGPLPIRKVWEDEDPPRAKLKKFGRYENNYPFIEKGFKLALPNDPEMFSGIEARFVLVSNKKEGESKKPTEPTSSTEYIPPLGVKAKK